MARAIDADALQELCDRKIQDTWNNGTAPVSWAHAYADFKDDIDSMPTLTPPNEALTIEQLRDMDGEPVWVQTPGIPQYGRWVIVAGVDMKYGQSTLYCQGDYTCRNYGRDWIAYRRPPEGDEDA